MRTEPFDLQLQRSGFHSLKIERPVLNHSLFEDVKEATCFSNVALMLVSGLKHQPFENNQY